jgi:hypothetical protein
VELIDAWTKSLSESGLRERMVRSYARDVKRIQRRLAGLRIENATSDQLLTALKLESREGLNAPDTRGMRASLQLLLNFLAIRDGRPRIELSPVATRTTGARVFTPRPYKPVRFKQLADPEFLRSRYVGARMGTEEIAQELGTTKQNIVKALRAHGIAPRSHSQAWKASAEKDHTRIVSNPFNEEFFSA